MSSIQRSYTAKEVTAATLNDLEKRIAEDKIGEILHSFKLNSESAAQVYTAGNRGFAIADMAVTRYYLRFSGSSWLPFCVLHWVISLTSDDNSHRRPMPAN